MSKTRQCGNCGATVPEGHYYCGQCGANVHEKGGDDTIYYGPIMAPGKAKLILVRGEGLEGLSYHLNATEHIAGRQQGEILFPEDPYLSPKHAAFFYRDNKLHVRDESSQNGTFVQLESPTELADGAEFQVGDQMFRIEYLNIQSDYPQVEDTLMYVSPPQSYRFRVIHLLDEGKPGSAYCASDNQLMIGREACDINFPNDPYLSKQHAQLSWHNGRVVIKDLGTKNGVFVRIDESVRLHHGDYISLGKELLRVEINE